MLDQDLERDFLKDAIYLHEQVLELQALVKEEIVRNAAIIKVIKDDSKNNIQEVRNTNPARIYVGYDLSFEDGPTGSGCNEVVSGDSQVIPTLSNTAQEATDH